MNVKNVDQLIFFLNSWKKNNSNKKSNKEFSEKLKELFLEDQIEKEVYQTMLQIIGEKSSNDSGKVLYEKIKVSDGDGCRGPTITYREVKQNVDPCSNSFSRSSC